MRHDKHNIRQTQILWRSLASFLIKISQLIKHFSHSSLMNFSFNSNRKKYFPSTFIFTYFSFSTLAIQKLGQKYQKNVWAEQKYTRTHQKNKNENKNENKNQQNYGTNGGKWTWTNLRPIIFVWL